MNYSDMTVKDLRELAKERELEVPAPGNKAQLIIALEAADEGLPEEPEIIPEPEDDQEPEIIPEPEDDQKPEIIPEPEDNQKPETIPEPETSKYMAYVGPAIPGGLLSHGKILYGTDTSIREYLAPVLERFPKVEGLLVPMERLEQAMKDVKNPKKLLFHKAEELKTEIKRNGG